MFGLPWPFASFLGLHATKCCVDVRIVRLEPISERSSEHTRRCSRASRLSSHNVCHQKNPPNSPHKILLAQNLRTARIASGSTPIHFPAYRASRTHWLLSAWIRSATAPIFENQNFHAPGKEVRSPRDKLVRLFHLCPICCTMKFRFTGQFFSQPFCIRTCFCVTHVHRPVQWQANFAKHRPIHPHIACASPKPGMGYSFAFFPFLCFAAPKRLVLVAPCLHELQKLAVRYIAIQYGERRNVHLMRFKLVVPSKLFAMSCTPSPSVVLPAGISIHSGFAGGKSLVGFRSLGGFFSPAQAGATGRQGFPDASAGARWPSRPSSKARTVRHHSLASQRVA